MRTTTLTTIGLAALLAATLVAAGPVSAATAANGAASATYGTCPEGSDAVVLQATNAAGIWTISYTLVSACDGYNNSGSATGPWNPDDGGCIGLICLTSPSGTEPGAITYDYFNGYEFHSGTAALVVA